MSLLPETLNLWFRTLTGRDHYKQTPIRSYSHLRFGGDRQPGSVPIIEAFTNFNRLTAVSASVAAATTDIELEHIGTGTEVVSRSTKGGINYKSQATTPADGDNVLVTPAETSTGMYGRISAGSGLRFETAVSINTIATVFASFGLNENLTDADPTGTAGEGALFLFDPTQEVTTGLTNAQHDCWILAHKVNGADTFTATTVKVNAGQIYNLVIELQTDLTCKFYIDGTYVGVGPALTSGDTVGVFLGLELTAAPDGQQDIDVGYVSMARNFGA
jgi:hypothetical protein